MTATISQATISVNSVWRNTMRKSSGERRVSKIKLRDAHGRIQGSYQRGKFDQRPVAGKDLTLGIDLNLQALGERLLQGKIGSIVAIDPKTGEVLCHGVVAPYDPRRLVGKMRGKMHRYLSHDP